MAATVQHRKSRPGLAPGLSSRLLILTILFVMLGEFLIYAPSMANFWKTYLDEKLQTGHLAALALEATPDFMVSPDLSRELLGHAGAHLVVLIDLDGSKRILTLSTPPTADLTLDIETFSFVDYLLAAVDTLRQDGNRVLRVIGPSPKNTSILIEVLIDEAPMRAAMLHYSWNILQLSVMISVITAGLVFFALRWLMVRPIRRITDSMLNFQANPEDASREIRPSGRRDEIGLVEETLAGMQKDLRLALSQKTRLAALGAAMTRINHDLRNILSAASLVSDRLSASTDPDVRKVAPTLIRSIDRAVTLCVRTLEYARRDAPLVRPEPIFLRPLIEELATPLKAEAATDFTLENRVGEDFRLVADRDQIDRVLTNLIGNARQAGAHKVSVSACRRNASAEIDISDNGPGLPPNALKSLFEPFAGSEKAGGSGLGLAIAREIVAAHGGGIEMVRTGCEGTTFRLYLPLGD
ncbi:MAG: HAMP domain-containing sensor histidine kinase [Alphaproteobacteria bacterium]